MLMIDVLKESTKVIAEMTKNVFKKDYQVMIINTENGGICTDYSKLNKNEKKALINELNSDDESKSIEFFKNNCVCVM